MNNKILIEIIEFTIEKIILELKEKLKEATSMQDIINLIDMFSTNNLNTFKGVLNGDLLIANKKLIKNIIINKIN